MWMAYWLKHPENADYYGASRLRFILGIYGEKVGLLEWVTGEGWKTNPKDAKRSLIYYENAMALREKHFGGSR